MKSKMRGFSLIELMVGILLSLLVLVALMALYSNSVKNTAASNVGVKLDGDIYLGLLQIDRLTQNAGFGLSHATPYGNLIQVYSGGNAVPITTGKATGDAVAWKITATECQALVASASGVVLRGGAAGYTCSTPALPAAGISSESIISIPSSTIDGIGALGTVTFEVQTASNCFPFGISASIAGQTAPTLNGGAYRLVTQADTYARSTTAAKNTVVGSTCLFNVR